MDTLEGRSGPREDLGVDELVAWVDRVGEDTMLDTLDWEPRRAVVVQMPGSGRSDAEATTAGQMSQRSGPG